MSALEWNGKIEPKIRPDMTAKQVREQLKQAEGNGHVVRFAALWKLIGSAWPDPNPSQRSRPPDQDGGPARTCGRMERPDADLRRYRRRGTFAGNLARTEVRKRMTGSKCRARPASG